MWVADGWPWWPAVLTVVPLPPLPSPSRLRAWNDGTRLSDKLPQPDDTWHASPLPAKSWYTGRCLTSVLPNLVASEAEAFFCPLKKSFNCPSFVLFMWTCHPVLTKATPLQHVRHLSRGNYFQTPQWFSFFSGRLCRGHFLLFGYSTIKPAENPSHFDELQL